MPTPTAQLSGPSTNAYENADRKCDGHLADLMRAYYQELGSWEKVQRRFDRDHDVVVSAQTWRRWGQMLGITTR